MPQGTKKMTKTNLKDTNKPRHSPKHQKKAVLAIAVKKQNLQLHNRAKNNLSRVINKNIEQALIAKAEADKPGILHVVKSESLKHAESKGQRKTLEKQVAPHAIPGIWCTSDDDPVVIL